jgi:hypothetical protein
VSGTAGLGEPSKNDKINGAKGSKYRPTTGYYYGTDTSYEDMTKSYAKYFKKNYVSKAEPIDENHSSLSLDLAMILDEAEELLLKKHQDYGPDNINKSPLGPMAGLLVRMHDKQARAIHLINKGTDANYESLEDTFMDMLNYSAIAILVLRKQWPKS